jgi:hypothetical protein
MRGCSCSPIRFAEVLDLQLHFGFIQDCWKALAYEDAAVRNAGRGWRSLGEEERQRAVRALLREVEAEAREMHSFAPLQT